MARTCRIPGFRFSPTDDELVVHHLKRKLLGKENIIDVVAEVNIYDFSPWELPDKSALKSGDLEWYFFCRNAKKYTTGFRLNRSTKAGFWKPTGTDKEVKYEERTVGKIKTLIFHNGRTEKGQRTDWVMHEYRMDDEQLAKAGVIQDTYTLCKIFQKSGLGPKNGAQYGAPFNEKEWDDDLASSSGSQAIVVLVCASNSTDYKQKGPAKTSMTGPGSSSVTYPANKPADTQNFKQKGPATTSMTGPGASMLTFSANEPTNTQNLKRKGPATSNPTGPGSPDATFSVNEPTNTRKYRRKGPATVNLTGPGSSVVPFSANEPTNTLNYKQKGPATTNMTGPGASMLTFSANEPTNTQNLKRKGPATSNLTGPGSPDATFSVNEPTNTRKYWLKGPATVNLTGPGSSVVPFSANEPTNTLNYNQRGPATMDMTEPGSPVVSFSANEPTNTLNYKQKGPATMNMSVSQITHSSFVTEPGSSSVMLSPNEMDASHDGLSLDDIDGHEETANVGEVKTMGPNADDDFFDDLKNLLDLDFWNTDVPDYKFDELLRPSDPDLGGFSND